MKFDEIFRREKQKIQLLSIDEKLPLYHGTSKKSADIIIKEGMKPRKESNVESVWGNNGKSHLISDDDKIYFAQCKDQSLPFRSAITSVNQHYTSKEKDGYDYQRFIKLKNIKPYLSFLADDEDYDKDKFFNESIYSNREKTYFPMRTFPLGLCLPRIPKKIINSIDIVWAKCHQFKNDTEYCSMKIKELIDVIPQGKRSLHFIKTLGITKNIDPSDIEVLTLKEYKNRVCPKLNGGCSEKELQLKKAFGQASNEYNMLLHNKECHDFYIKQGISLKKQLLNGYCLKISNKYKKNNDWKSNEFKNGLTKKDVEYEITQNYNKTKHQLIEFINKTKFV